MTEREATAFDALVFSTDLTLHDWRLQDGQSDLASGVAASWQRLRAARPLVHCITNVVSMDVGLMCLLPETTDSLAGPLLKLGACSQPSACLHMGSSVIPEKVCHIHAGAWQLTHTCCKLRNPLLCVCRSWQTRCWQSALLQPWCALTLICGKICSVHTLTHVSTRLLPIRRPWGCQSRRAGITHCYFRQLHRRGVHCISCK